MGISWMRALRIVWRDVRKHLVELDLRRSDDSRTDAMLAVRTANLPVTTTSSSIAEYRDYSKSAQKRMQGRNKLDIYPRV